MVAIKRLGSKSGDRYGTYFGIQGVVRTFVHSDGVVVARVPIAKVFHLVGRILEEKTSSPSLTVAQATTDILAFEDPEEVAKRQARLAAKTIASFDAHTSDDKVLTMSYDSPESAGITYLCDVAARPVRERRGIQPGVGRMVNDIGILMVNQTRGNATRIAPCCVMMDSGAQPVMIGKRIWFTVHSPLSHPLVTWSGRRIILGSHYNLVFE